MAYVAPRSVRSLGRLGWGRWARPTSPSRPISPPRHTSPPRSIAHRGPRRWKKELVQHTDKSDGRAGSTVGAAVGGKQSQPRPATLGDAPPPTGRRSRPDQESARLRGWR